MRNMTQEQADDYRKAAVRAYIQMQPTDEAAARQAVNRHIEGEIDRFVAMDKAGKLDGYLETCPQPGTSRGG